ncbi:hypothetical protein RCH12_003661 [Cryobacterium sp. MP_3.1]|uniref:hypothetical protein n=1 Tax=Cryobacterium sp. MP_3.1 TaxID=3071711 RepID=UPI002DFC966B|nr:hypothetical protein [Cryobacterium sp. MP_3.1]
MVATILFIPKVIKAQLATDKDRLYQRGFRGSYRLKLGAYVAVPPEVEFALVW